MLKRLFTNKGKRNHIDRTVFLAVLILLVLSLGVVYSATSSLAMLKWKDSEEMLTKHAVMISIGLLAMFAVMQIDYQRLAKYTKMALFVGVLLLLATLAMKLARPGVSRWLRLGPVGIQTADLARFLLIMHVAKFMADHKETLQDLKTGYVPLLFWLGLVAGLVLLQPSFSNGSIALVVSFTMFYLGGVRLKHIALTVLPALPLLALYMMSAAYRRQRVASYLEALLEPNGTMAHQVWQGIIGFGNGGIFGLGPGMSRQREFFLPESYGDFVFSIIGEEYGLVGTAAVMVVFAVIFLRGMRIAQHAPDDFGRNLAFGITLSVTFYAVVHSAVTLALVPPTGLPMPFVSYGGTSIVLSCVAMGILLNISRQTDLHPRVSTVESAHAGDGTSAPAVGRVY